MFIHVLFVYRLKHKCCKRRASLFKPIETKQQQIICQGFICSTHWTFRNSCCSDLYEHLTGYTALILNTLQRQSHGCHLGAEKTHPAKQCFKKNPSAVHFWSNKGNVQLHCLLKAWAVNMGFVISFLGNMNTGTAAKISLDMKVTLKNVWI